jgi:hypothetical protein
LIWIKYGIRWCCCVWIQIRSLWNAIWIILHSIRFWSLTQIFSRIWTNNFERSGCPAGLGGLDSFLSLLRFPNKHFHKLRQQTSEFPEFMKTWAQQLGARDRNHSKLFWKQLLWKALTYANVHFLKTWFMVRRA